MPQNIDQTTRQQIFEEEFAKRYDQLTVPQVEALDRFMLCLEPAELLSLVANLLETRIYCPMNLPPEHEIYVEDQFKLLLALLEDLQDKQRM